MTESINSISGSRVKELIMSGTVFVIGLNTINKYKIAVKPKKYLGAVSGEFKDNIIKPNIDPVRAK
ncbi:MAG: hypothetical protein ACQEQC_02400 [Elusimicrobiota bacterium]